MLGGGGCHCGDLSEAGRDSFRRRACGARVIALPPGEIAAHLDGRLRLLTVGRRVERHHTSLRATIDWSYAFRSDFPAVGRTMQPVHISDRH
jgi:hypothetical protein